MKSKIALADARPLFVGHKRAIYQHPQDEGLLIKIIRPDSIERRWGANAPWYKKLSRAGRYVNYFREVGEFICMYARNGGISPAIQRISGFAQTDLGLGLVVEKLVDREGQIAPPLKSLLLGSGLTKELSAQVDELVDELLRTGVILTKLNTRNIVRAWDAEHGTRLVILDGMGSKAAIPVYAMSEWANGYNTRRKAKELRMEIEKLISRNRVAQIETEKPVLS